ncbi:MAG: energy transducer TonB [Candidatus Omnitrophica bacterium]|nr:energy transducer TonB [Candidatus Omnitrophota bacterium]
MSLFRNRALNSAILISVLWHFLLIVSVNPVFKTGDIIKHDTSISFLGSILERIMPGEEKPLMSRSSPKEIKIDKIEIVDAGFINREPEKIDFFYYSDTNNFFNLNAYHKKEAARVNFPDFFIKGEAKDRMIIYKPDLDKVTVLPSDFNSDYSATIKFKISSEGFVKYAECIISSGFSEIDQLAIRYVKKWQFVPSPDEDDQEGVVRVSFK